MSCAACDRPDNWGFDTQIKRMDEREKLRQYFLTLPPEQQVHGWDKMWERKITPWDQNRPNPALVEALETKPQLTGSPFTDAETRKERKKALVPGCGGGYDVQLFASYGYDAYGLDASKIAVDKAEQHLRAQGKEQTYKLQSIQNGRGEACFLLADFFRDDFLAATHEGVHPSKPRTFDIIYDYTFLCALPPPLRPRWAARMSQLLAPGGILICTEYPLGKDPRLGGPPFGVFSSPPSTPFANPQQPSCPLSEPSLTLPPPGLSHALYEQLLNKPGLEVNYDLNGRIVEDRSGDKTDAGLEEVASWVPGQIFEPQKGQVAVSVWRHWKR